jgi:hypothetical protein
VVGVNVCLGLSLSAGTAQASPLRWCPGDPPPKALLSTPGGGSAPGPVNPAWDTNVCHNYTRRDNQVAKGIGCPLPQFQWFQCPPGTTPEADAAHPQQVGISRAARVAQGAVSPPVWAQPHLDAGTADIRRYLGRCQRRSCNRELAKGEANCKSRYRPRPMVRST